jgi:ABC-type sugar transport system ATPase subunit
MAQVSIQQLTVRFGDFLAVDRLSLDIADGELVVTLGPSGCGKTTTLRCIAGLEQPSAGAILFDGRRVDELPPSARNIAMVFQFVSLYPHLKVKDNIAFPLRARKVPKKTIRAKLDWITALFKLDDILHRYPLGLPPGAKQKVALARAVVREPNVLLLDEPLSAIDEQFREEMRWELGHLQKQLGFTTVYVTHDQREAMSLADRIVLMKDGRIEQVGTPQELFAEPATEFAGFFIGSPGMNFIAVELKDEQLLLGREKIPMRLEPGVTAKLRARASGPLKLGIRPQHVTLADGSEQAGVFRAPIVDRYRIGREQFFDFKIDDGLYQGMAIEHAGKDKDASIRFALDKIHFFDPRSGERLRLD